jgi:hypothetical protein
MATRSLNDRPLLAALESVRAARVECEQRGLTDCTIAQALMLEAMDAMCRAYGPRVARSALEELAPLFDQL